MYWTTFLLFSAPENLRPRKIVSKTKKIPGTSSPSRDAQKIRNNYKTGTRKFPAYLCSRIHGNGNSLKTFFLQNSLCRYQCRYLYIYLMCKEVFTRSPGRPACRLIPSLCSILNLMRGVHPCWPLSNVRQPPDLGGGEALDWILRRRNSCAGPKKNSAVEMVPTPDINPFIMAFFGKLSRFTRIKPCFVFACEIAQKLHNLNSCLRALGYPAPAMAQK